MALDTYADLQSAIADWLDRADYTARIPDFIRMAEAEFDRVLRVPDMEARAIAQTVAGAERLTLPTDCAGLKSVSLLADIAVPLEGAPVAELHAMYGRAYSARPSAYAVSDGQLWFGPLPDGAYQVQLVYWRRIPALTTAAPSNWLLAKHPDLYLLASVMQAELYGWNDNRLPLLKARVDEIIAQIVQEGNRNARPAQARMRLGW